MTLRDEAARRLVSRSEMFTRIHDTLATVMEQTEADECACKPDTEPCLYCSAESALDDEMALEREEDAVRAMLAVVMAARDLHHAMTTPLTDTEQGHGELDALTEALDSLATEWGVHGGEEEA